MILLPFLTLILLVLLLVCRALKNVVFLVIGLPAQVPECRHA